MNFKSVLVSVSFLCVLFVGTLAAQTEKPADENQTLRTLLSEVRQLRKTMQTTGLNAYRGQIILERIRLVHEQVERMAEKLESAREDLEKIERTIPRQEEEAKVLERCFSKRLMQPSARGSSLRSKRPGNRSENKRPN